MKLPPGPSSLVEFFQMLLSRKRHPIKLYESIFKKYGDIVYFAFGPYKFAMLNEADAIEQVLHTEARNFTKSSGYERFKLIVGNGLLVSEGEVWKRQRRLLSWAFSPRHIEQIHPIMVKESLDMMERWRNQAEIDLAEEMNFITLQIISVSLFGKSQIKGSRDIRQAMQNILKYLQTTRHLWIQLLLTPFPFSDKRAIALKIEKLLPLKSSREFFRSINIIDQIVNNMIDERKKAEKTENFLDTLIGATDTEDQSQMTNKQLRDEVVNMLIAGHETTANALTWTWHQLLKYPEVMLKVKDELKKSVKGMVPNYEELASLHYTQAVFEESMRLYPPFWRISRKNKEQTTINNYDIPAGTNIIASIYTMQRKEQYWTDAHSFRPERFLQTNRNVLRKIFLPFGAGPRACIGAHMATIEALTIMATVLKHYEFEKKFEQDPEYFMSLTLQPKEGCKVRLKKNGEI